MADVGVTLDWANLDQAFGALEQELTDVTRGLGVLLWNSILTKTPQYFGGMAASWTWTYSPSNFKDRSAQIAGRQNSREFAPGEAWFSPNDIRFRGHPVAIGIANSASRGKDGEFRLGRTIYFTNGVDHGEGPYSVLIEGYDEEALRQYNRPGKPVLRTLDMAHARFESGVSAGMAKRLKAMRIGGGDAAGDS